MAGSVLAAVLLLAFPWLIRRAFDVAIPNERYGLLFMLALGAVGIQLVYLGVSIFVRRINFAVSGALSAQLRQAAIEKLYRLSDASCAYLDRASLHARFIIDIERVDQMTRALVGMLLPSLVVGSLLIVGLVAISWPLAILAVAVFALFIPLTSRVAALLPGPGSASPALGPRLQREDGILHRQPAADAVEGRREAGYRRPPRGYRLAGDEHASRGAVAGFFHRVAEPVRIRHRGDAARRRHRRGPAGLADDRRRAGVLRVRDAVSRPVRGVRQALTPVMEGFYSLSTVREVLELEELPDYGGSRTIDFRGNVEMRGVIFGYGGVPLLRGIDLVVRRGQRVGIVGANGSGKTTIVKLILGILAPDGGEILVDSVPLAEVDLPACGAGSGWSFRNR
ncbi:MAG: ABC transporter ATP-binding protein/permease [Gammaproteobacteria bacterium]|nr:ABC transporter ATP-binding protein/permease [Gammaproteobacteria bacterium]